MTRDEVVERVLEALENFIQAKIDAYSDDSNCSDLIRVDALRDELKKELKTLTLI